MHDNEKTAINREISIHRNLSHPHIVRLYNAFPQGNQVYIILEFMENGNIFKMIQETSLTIDMIVQIFSQVLSAVAYFHKQKIFHRDIKPENVLWDKTNTFKLSDFGFSARYQEQSGRKTMCGTTEYMAPEVIMSQVQDDKLDIWCLGILLYELIHKRTPFQAKNPWILMQSIKNKKVEFAPGVRPDFIELINLCLRVEPTSRPNAQYLLDHFPIFRLESKSTSHQSQETIRNSFENKKKINFDGVSFKKNKNAEELRKNDSASSLFNNQKTTQNFKPEKDYLNSNIYSHQDPKFSKTMDLTNNKQVRIYQKINPGTEKGFLSTPTKSVITRDSYTSNQFQDARQLTTSASSFLNHDNAPNNFRTILKTQVMQIPTQEKLQATKIANLENVWKIQNSKPAIEPMPTTEFQTKTHLNNLPLTSLAFKKVHDFNSLQTSFVNVYKRANPEHHFLTQPNNEFMDYSFKTNHTASFIAPQSNLLSNVPNRSYLLNKLNSNITSSIQFKPVEQPQIQVFQSPINKGIGEQKMRRVYSTDKAFIETSKPLFAYTNEIKQVPQVSSVQKMNLISPGQSFSVPRKIEVRKVTSGSFLTGQDHNDVKYRSFQTAMLPSDQSDGLQDQRYQLSPFLQK